MTVKYKAIIPCSGFGKRMNMLPTKSKEMLIDPKTNEPLINYHLFLCKSYGLSPIVITRKEKTDLISHLIENNIDYIISEKQGEWMDSVLETKDHWKENNILLLPDTRFTPKVVLRDIKSLLQKSSLVFATHQVDNISKWGAIEDDLVAEKPNETKSGIAWGIIGFNAKEGEALFEAYKQKGVWYKPKEFSLLPLKNFRDITRTGKIEYV